jgi:EpsI family protein
MTGCGEESPPYKEAAMLDRAAWLAPILIAAQGLLAWSPLLRESAPPTPDLTRFPNAAGAWQVVGPDPGADLAIESLHPDRLLDLNYTGRAPANLFVAWYRSQLAGNAQPHSPRMCLPGSGWMPFRTGETTIDTIAGPIQVNRWLVANGAQHAAVLYWYQKPRRVIPGEWPLKFWLAADALRDHRTDVAFVRIVMWPIGGNDDRALSDASDFAALIYPQLRQWMPQ